MFWRYESCRRCSGKPLKGTVALLNVLLDEYPYTRSLGVYNCRNVNGGSSLSIHACGRALDLGVPVLSNGRANTSLGDPIVRLLIQHANPLGLMGIIYNRVRYDYPDTNGAYYRGRHPHYNHLHIEQRSSQASVLTEPTIRDILNFDKGDDDVREVYARLQASLIRAGYDLGDWTPYLPASDPDSLPGADGVWGADSRNAQDAANAADPDVGLQRGDTVKLV